MFNPPWSTFLLRTLLENNDFTVDFINYFGDFLNVEFEPANVNYLIDEIASVIEPEMPNHLARWSLGSMSAWYNDVDELREFADLRPNYMYGDIVDYFNLSGTANVSLDVDPQGGGWIQINSKVIEEYPWDGVYFQGVPIQLTALPEEGYRFESWIGAQPPDSSTVILDLTGNVSVTAVFEADTIYDDSIVITEINYNSAPDFDTEDWLELYNNSDEIVDISNWVFCDAHDTNTFVFPQNTVLEPQGFLVLCRDTVAFSALFPEVNNILGNLDFNLSNGGELIRLFNASGEIVDSLTYDDDPPWPPEPDGQGPTLELLDPDLPNYNPDNWRASILPHGSPGSENGWTSLTVSLTPYGTPIQIPAGGGSFNFNIEVANTGSDPVTFDIWTMATLPNGSEYGPIINVPDFTAPASWSAARDRTQTVPGSAPAGTYTYDAYVGVYPDEIWDEDHFDFEKLMYGESGWVEGWTNTGESFLDWMPASEVVIPAVYALEQNYPNPFNPTTIIRFQLPEAGFITLEVFNVEGRDVGAVREPPLQGRWYPSGVNQITFDGSGLPSGIYIYRLTAGDFTESGKMILLK